MKHTPLYPLHLELGAKLTEFGGWEMPVYYTSIMEEHQAVRTAAGIFDISHMGQFRVRGPGAAQFLNSVFTNNILKLSPGQGQYTLLCREDGGVVDDLYAYQLAAQEFLLVVNASRIETDLGRLRERLELFAGNGGVRLENVSADSGAVAVQGPKAASFIDACFSSAEIAPSGLRKNEIVPCPFEGGTALVSRTGYTGEDGFEIMAPAATVPALWRRLLDAGREAGLQPAGLGARDTLRTEACYPLFGHELDEKTTPIEAGLGFFVALDKGEFTGRAVLAAQKAAGTARKLAAFKMTGRSAPPRPGYPIFSAGASPVRLGEVTSGTQSPTLGCGIGLGYVPAGHSAVDTPLNIEIRGKAASAIIVRKPFYRKA